MKKVPPKQYTIKGLPKNVNLYLQDKARQEKKSLNQVIIECLKQSADKAKNGRLPSPHAPEQDAWLNDAKLEKETAYLDILDADPSI